MTVSTEENNERHWDGGVEMHDDGGLLKTVWEKCVTNVKSTVG